MDIQSLIGSYGFPIVACIGCGWFIKFIITYFFEKIDKLTDSFEKIMLAYKEDVTKAINNNTVVLERFCITQEKNDRKGGE